MRSLKRNQRDLWYAIPTGTKPILDEYGNDTLEVEITYGSPILLRCNVSANMGEETVEVFGSQTEYSRVVCIVGECPFIEGTQIWFNRVPEEESHNYIVARIADSKNGYLAALREVTPHA